MGECVKVAVRCRPLNSKEKADNRAVIVEVDGKIGQVTLHNPKGDEPPKTFTFDNAFDWNVTQKEVYDVVARPIVNSVADGYNGTIFAYGQTGTGKTHTMEGQPTPELQGIIPNCFDHIFELVNGSSGRQWMVRASYLEIYNEEVRDLLSKDPKNKLELKEHKDSGVYVKGLNAFVVKGVPELKNVLEVGKKNRSVGATLMNQDSSRSHSIFTITIETIEQTKAQPEGHIKVGKLNLVDLAGSERQSKTGATGDRLKEATKINLSLSALGNVISALVDGKSGHVPYRDSKLTRLLQDSLGGNTKTIMCANMGPADWNYDETLSTLRYANRAKNIKNKPKINEDPKDAMLREFQEEISRLKALLAAEGGALPEGAAAGPGGELVVEKVVTVPKALDAAFLEKMRRDMEEQMKAELAAKQAAALNEEQLQKVKEEAAAKAKAEADRLAEEKRRAEEEAAKMQRKQQKIKEEMEKKSHDAEQIRAEKEALAKKLKAMESKILKGDAAGGLAEVTKKKEEELKKKEQELERRRREEDERRQKIAAMEEAQLAAEEKYKDKADEAEQKTKKLKKLWKKFQEVNAEVEDMYKEFQREKEDLLESIRMLQDQMQLKDMVIEAFIPPEEVQKVMKRAHWDDEREVWVLERLSDIGKRETAAGNSRRPVSASGQRRPTSDFAKLANAMGDMNPRFKSENILNLELDLPERTTYDYEGPGVDPRVQAAINAAFAEDGEFIFVGSEQNVHLGEVTANVAQRPDSAKKRPASARKGTKASR
ncbi:kinesin-like protein [Volvox carteri f. nagariensis]|uniref:Kinesin-like protein n=1 Tax=Volvox carteri f. nagariensis TaxID=3068 RepID=D8TN81_VOLCA|nr:kinesin-like protein [Volvox carteri f. nagariensis]EFJ51094.1 kinesin-like protein [Volvox carteri f. nagariensis]|eukprot:XP_002948106.1 kinesin-like protein [Volvox carteri f. nagariensis]